MATVRGRSMVPEAARVLTLGSWKPAPPSDIERGAGVAAEMKVASQLSVT